ncbi:hypothetical protein AX16_003875 [Volvariella volvacea WC 439]|nr:hypothetical protein AX16_003875 [Volvariella volvacea WC 439]
MFGKKQHNAQANRRKVVVLGDDETGKTYLLSSFTGHTICYPETSFIQDFTFDEQNVEIAFWDYPSHYMEQKYRDKMEELILMNAVSLVVMAFSVDDPSSLDSIATKYKLIILDWRN